MGMFGYGSAMSRCPVEDRALMHVQIVIIGKLRRRERFFFRCAGSDDACAAESFWMSPDVPLLFEYDEPALPPINRAWLAALGAAGNSGAGLWLVPEPVHPRRSETSNGRVGTLAGASR